MLEQALATPNDELRCSHDTNLARNVWVATFPSFEPRTLRPDGNGGCLIQQPIFPEVGDEGVEIDIVIGILIVRA